MPVKREPQTPFRMSAAAFLPHGGVYFFSLTVTLTSTVEGEDVPSPFGVAVMVTVCSLIGASFSASTLTVALPASPFLTTVGSTVTLSLESLLGSALS